jgi:hypothetical protein
MGAGNLVLKYRRKNMASTQKHQPFLSSERKSHFKTHNCYWNRHLYTVTGPDGARNYEWLCWRRPTAHYCSAVCNRSRNISQSVDIAIGWTTRVWFPWGARDFSFPYGVQTGSGAHTTSYPMGTRAVSQAVKWSRREAVWRSYTSTPLYEFVELYFIS